MKALDTRLGRYICWSFAVLALAVVVVVVFAPSIAQAEQYQSTVVDSGESLWTISAERLGPEATTEQISGGVEQIYALNRERIGSDPDLIFVGQELLLPAKVAAEVSPSASGPETVRTLAKTPAVAWEDPGGESEATDLTRPLSLPDVPAAVRAPAAMALTAEGTVGSPAISALAGYFAELRVELRDGTHAGRREALGTGILMLTFLAAVLLLWRLPLRRDTRYAERRGQLPLRGTAYTYPYVSHDSPERVHGADVSSSASSSLGAASGIGLALRSPARGQGGSVDPLRVARLVRSRTRMRSHGWMRSSKRVMCQGSVATQRADPPPGRRSPRAALRDRRRSKSRKAQNAAVRREVRRPLSGR